MTLTPHTTYFLMTQEFAGGDQWSDFGLIAANASAGTVNSASYQYNGTYYLVGNTPLAYGTPNLLFH